MNSRGRLPPLLRRLGAGRILYWLWHAPAGLMRNSLAAGGPVQQWITARGRRAMEQAAGALPPQEGLPARHLPELHFLTGRKFWYQTAFCLHSLQRHTGIVFRTVLHDDGTLAKDEAARLQRLFPGAEIRQRPDSDARLAALLPPPRYPHLHAERRRPYPNFLKLTDVHAGTRGWKLVLDSDMLFFRRPDFLLKWLQAPDRPLHMIDVQDSYGYPRPLLESLAGASLPARLNVGICGLRSEELDWDRLETWCWRLQEAAGTSYYLEQVLVAMLCAGRAC
ncbi:MAG: glycosyl transferase family 2, partial [Opitutaceae bacterium]